MRCRTLDFRSPVSKGHMTVDAAIFRIVHGSVGNRGIAQAAILTQSVSSGCCGWGTMVCGGSKDQLRQDQNVRSEKTACNLMHEV